jgi:outer membrane protein assembly factor BamB
MLIRVMVSISLSVSLLFAAQWTFAQEEPLDENLFRYEDLTPKSLSAKDGTAYGGDLVEGFSKWAEDGSIEWSKNFGIVYGKPIEGEQGNIYFGSSNGRVYAISPVGEALWQIKTQGPFYHGPTLNHQATTLYAVTQNGWLYALNTTDGKELWRLDLGLATGAQVRSTPTVSPEPAGGAALYITDSDNKLYAINLTTHNLSWVRVIGQ